MARGVNKVILIGNLGADPETRYMQDNAPVANFSLATSETWKDKTTGEQREETEWHRCVAYRRLAEIVGQYLKKGAKVYVEGKIKTSKWTDQNGVERYTTQIIVNDLQMLDSRSAGDQPCTYQPAQQNQAPSQAKASAPAYTPPPANFDDDIPF